MSTRLQEWQGGSCEWVRKTWERVVLQGDPKGSVTVSVSLMQTYELIKRISQRGLKLEITNTLMTSKLQDQMELM